MKYDFETNLDHVRIHITTIVKEKGRIIYRPKKTERSILRITMTILSSQHITKIKNLIIPNIRRVSGGEFFITGNSFGSSDLPF